jgi:hypothetical protein
MVSEIYLPQKFSLNTKGVLYRSRGRVKHCFGGMLISRRERRAPVIEASDSLVVGDHAAQLSSQSFNFGELLSDTIKQC